jgi:hypothetical protein
MVAYPAGKHSSKAAGVNPQYFAVDLTTAASTPLGKQRVRTRSILLST